MPNDAVCATGLGLMMLFCETLPKANYWEEVQAYLRKPGRAIQHIRKLGSQIKERLVDDRKTYAERFAMLREHIACIDTAKVRQEDPSGNASLVYEFLAAAASYYEEINPHCKDYSSPIKRITRQPSRQSVSRSYNPSSQRTCEGSPTFNEVPEASYLPAQKSKQSIIMPAEASPDVIFSTGDPDVIEKFLEKETLNVKKLAAERRKAEWDEARNYKTDLARKKREQMLQDIENYRSQSRKNLRESSLSRLTKVKEQREQNASVLEYRRLFRQQQQADIKDSSIDEHGKALAKLSQRRASRSPMRSVVEDDLSPDEQNRVRSRIMELKLLHKQLQEKSSDERRSLSLLRGSRK